MSRLVVNSGTPQAWEISLKPGANSLGRSDANDFRINDQSVSGSHCQILVDESSTLLTDLGSTNGTFVGGLPIREQQLADGQAVRLGNVEMVFFSGATAAPRKAMRVASAGIPIPPPVAIYQKPPVAEVPKPAASEVMTGQRCCKYHPGSPAHYVCPKCDKSFCGVCVNTAEMGERRMRTCRLCGGEVVPFQFRAAPDKSFYAKLPGAFAYPFKGAGVVILICATVAVAALNFISGGIFGIFLRIALYGSVFLFMQNIILLTTSDEKLELCFPDMSGLFGAAGQLAGTVLASFWLAIGLEIAKLFDMEVPSEAIIASVILGGIYFPMALLAVAMKDTVLAANPLIVIPAMMKVPLKYSVTAILTLLVFGIRQLGNMVSGGAGKLMFKTHSMNEFFGAVAYQMLWAVLSVYLLTVTMRLLGLFYNSSKKQLGWFNF